MTDFNKLKVILKDMNEDNQKISKEIQKIVAKYAHGLDVLIDKIQKEVRLDSGGSIEDLPSSLIENYCYEITALLYYCYTGLEEIGIRLDAIVNEKKNKYNEAFLQAQGTAQDRKAKAELAIHEYYTIENIYKRSYNVLRGKMDSAEKMYTSFKKTMSKRISESDFDRSSSKYRS